MLKGTLRRLSRVRKTKSGLSGPVAGMQLTFRAEVMPGRESDQRTFEVTRVLASGRIELADLHGEHAITEFEALTG